MKRFIFSCLFVAAAVFAMAEAPAKIKNSIVEVKVTSPHNTPTYNRVDVTLAHPDPVYIEYSDETSGKNTVPVPLRQQLPIIWTCCC